MYKCNIVINVYGINNFPFSLLMAIATGLPIAWCTVCHIRNGQIISSNMSARILNIIRFIENI